MFAQKRGAKRSSSGDTLQRRPNKQRKIAGASSKPSARDTQRGGPSSATNNKGKGKPNNKGKKSIYDVYEASDAEEEERRVLARRGGGGGSADRVMDLIDNFEFEGVEIDEEDDEELDEDEAFGESDEEKYGMFFDNKSSKKSKPQTSMELDLNEDDDAGEEDEEGDEDEDMDDDDEEYDSDEVMDLSDMLNDGKPSASSSKSTSSKSRGIDDVLLPRDADDDELEDIGEGSSDENEDDDDEEGDEEDEEVDLEVDDEGAEGGEESADLTSFITSLDGRKPASTAPKRKPKKETTEAFEESEYNLPARNTYTNTSTATKLELTDLMGAISGETSFGGLKKQLEGLEKAKKGKFGTASAPLPKRVQDRHEREAAYEQSKKEVTKWARIVKKNREAERLELPTTTAAIPAISSGGLASQFKASTDMEKEVQQILQEASLVDSKAREAEALELNRIDKEELIERRAELAKMRSLLFFQEKKQKKIAKIKSKAYRKIHKKDKGKEDLSLEELKALDPELARAEMEKLDAQRAMERISLKHKNTGKWAKQMLGKHIDTETRRAISDQLEQHEALKRKIRGIESDESESDLADEDEDEGPDTARENALKALGVLEREVEVAQGERPVKGVFAMKFMQRGLEAQMKESREEVRKAMEEMEDEEMGGSEGDSGNEEEEEEDAGAGKLVAQNSGRMVFGGAGGKKGVKPTTTAESEGSDDDEEMDQDTAFSARASGPIRIGASQPAKTVKVDSIFPVQQFELEEPTDNVFIGNANKRQLQPEASDVKPAKQTSKPTPITAKATSFDAPATEETFTIDKRPTRRARGQQDDEAEADNPWLQADDDSKPVKKSTKMVSDKNLGKTERAMEKLARERKSARKAELEEGVGNVQLSLGGIKELEQRIDDVNSEPALPTSKSAPKPAPKPVLRAESSDEDSDVEEAATSKMVHTTELKNLSRRELLQMAFANDDVAAEFEGEKEKAMELDKPKEEDLTLPGWGSWGGTGVQPKKRVVKAPKPGEGVEVEKRQDAKLKHVIINEKRMKKATKYMVPQLPHGFDTLEQYERTIRMPLGKEWNATSQHKEVVKPRVQTKIGHVITPLTLPGSNSGNKRKGAGEGGPKKGNPRPRKL
ncbi:hypothetical protein HK097_004777 [Rhizophlyctis rosea]|uniref:U3 small nucleolar RNA-associated protein 14 n=1 Tax=Rhizophlyctis rosea TaxID=64517 RepID=A0AAD5SDV1_9FUNG|nr:hypothetical protein HK097_004777 [Rhizophlyctis rosea]